MKANKYQRLASRTCQDGLVTNSELTNYTLGLAGETGEVVELIKKCVYHGHALHEEDIKKELGDVLWYVSALCTCLGYDLKDVMRMNIDKLKKRYPEKFSQEASINRSDDET
jgi:NTP pyrophosphatase (non-canonical NTP hydrolase)